MSTHYVKLARRHMPTADLCWSPSGCLQQRYEDEFGGSMWINVPKRAAIITRSADQSEPSRRAADAGEVLDELKRVLDLRTDTALAAHLGVPKTTITSRRLRNSVPYEIAIRVALANGISCDELLTRPQPGGGMPQ